VSIQLTAVRVEAAELDVENLSAHIQLRAEFHQFRHLPELIAEQCVRKRRVKKNLLSSLRVIYACC
jgi:hypothetical protein